VPHSGRQRVEGTGQRAGDLLHMGVDHRRLKTAMAQQTESCSERCVKGCGLSSFFFFLTLR
jgi:hypothetical protein